MFRSLLLILVISLLSMKLHAQKKTYFGIETGPKWDLYQLTDNGSDLFSSPVPGGTYGFYFGQELNKGFIAETGLYGYEYYESIRFKSSQMPGFWSSNAFYTLQIPLRIKKPINLIKQRLFITPSFAYVFGINLEYGHPDSIGGYGWGSIGNINYSYDEYSSLSRTLHLLETGISIDYRFKNGLELTLDGKYAKGLNKVYRQEVKYTIGSSKEFNGTYSSRGDYMKLTLGLKYPISKIRNEKELRKLNKGKRDTALAISRARRFYIMPLIGSTWKRFNITNHLIQGKEKSPPRAFMFSYADLTAGAKIGYKIFNSFYLETGLFMQFYGNSFFIENPNGNAYCGISTYIEVIFTIIPLNFKYSKDLIKNRLAIVPYLGMSFMNHKVELNKKYSGGCSRSTIEIDGVITDSSFTTTSAYRLRKSNLLFNVGVGIEFQLTKNIIFVINADYSEGFKSINRFDVVNERNGKIEKGSIFYEGDNFTVTTGFKFPINL